MLLLEFLRAFVYSERGQYNSRIEAMQKNNRVKRIKIAVILLSAVFACSYLGRNQISANLSEAQSQRRFEIVGIDAPLAERAGTDDGAAFAIHFIGNTHGSLEPCG